MASVVVEAHSLSKEYDLHQGHAGRSNLRETLSGLMRPPLHQSLTDGRFYALQDVSFQLEEGQSLAVLGHNGAGKSTLFKILARVIKPSSGRARIRGRIGSLLEIGMGFHQELTGQENILLSGALLGMKRSEIQRRFEEIVDFSGIESFIDTPVKYYSTGMYARLAFSVAAHLENEVMLVDEALSVGDTAFQRKCVDKMRTLARADRAVLFVSHDLAIVSELCERALLLERGRIVAYGPTENVIQTYRKNMKQEEIVVEWSGDDGDDEVRLIRTRVAATPGKPLLSTDEILAQCLLEVRKPVRNLVVALEIYSEAEHHLLAYSAQDDLLPPPAPLVPPGRLPLEICIPPNTLAAGRYELRFDIGIHNVKRIIDNQGALRVLVENTDGLGMRFPDVKKGLLRMPWSWRRLTDVELTQWLA